jgi:hypothetical protein
MVKECLWTEGRFQHLTIRDVEQIQSYVDTFRDRLVRREHGESL